MPWERDLSVNHCRMGPKGNWHIKPHVETWMEYLSWELYAQIPKGYDLIAFVLPAMVKVTFRFPDHLKRDDHNYYYVITNAVAIGLRIDDENIRISTESVRVDGKNPGFTIEITDQAGK